MSSVETGQMSAVETGQMSAETGQMSAGETRQMYSIKTGQRPVIIVDICLVSTADICPVSAADVCAVTTAHISAGDENDFDPFFLSKMFKMEFIRRSPRGCPGVMDGMVAEMLKGSPTNHTRWQGLRQLDKLLQISICVELFI